MTAVSRIELRKMVLSAVHKQTGYIERSKICEQKDNPQVIEMRLRSEGMLTALEAVLDAIDNNPVLLRIMEE